MENILKKDRLSPYFIGICIGILSWITVYFMHEKIGTTTTIAKAAAWLENLAFPSHISGSAYCTKIFAGKALIGWQQAFVLFIVAGSYIASRGAGKSRVEHVPTIWKKNFGPSKGRRYLGAFIGGAILLFGARLADGCTSGHGISGGLQLAISGWVFLIAMFAGGMMAAFTLYRKQ